MADVDAEALRRSLADVRTRLAAAAVRSGRDPSQVTLVAVSKTHPPEAVRAVHAAGQRVFGENYGQELRDKAAALADLGDLEWHFIGPLQRNKVRYAVGTAAMVQSVDSIDLMDELHRRAAARGTDLACLVEVNIAGEQTKSGVPPDEVAALLHAFAARPRLRCLGLMTMPPVVDDPEESRPRFRALRALRDALAASPRPGVELRHLSMGMTQDFEVAIEEGATIVRVGTAIFGAR
ncbi:MAG: YggS family pyridoxal phosphate-dependent enzyme [Deltaproteobacteria bacterium]|nr:YggS family pyridoxal phosphate-dependent enzyme [Deltaproteobacteria bacterium]